MQKSLFFHILILNININIYYFIILIFKNMQICNVLVAAAAVVIAYVKSLIGSDNDKNVTNFAHLTMKNDSFARFARAFFILDSRFVSVLLVEIPTVAVMRFCRISRGPTLVFLILQLACRR